MDEKKRTPKTVTVKTGWLRGHPFPNITEVEEREAEFDRWLAEHDRVVAANAWDEGYNVGGHAASGDYLGIYGGNGQEPSNPYRIAEETR